MVGFTESLNVSVAAAIILQDVSSKLQKKPYKLAVIQRRKRGALFRLGKKRQLKI
jgi:SpoU rRNA Methylase family.